MGQRTSAARTVRAKLAMKAPTVTQPRRPKQGPFSRLKKDTVFHCCARCEVAARSCAQVWIVDLASHSARARSRGREASFRQHVGNVRAAFGRDFSTLVGAMRSVRAPFGRDFATLTDAIRNVRAFLGGSFSTFANAIHIIRALFGRDFYTLADAIRNVWALFGGDFSMFAYAIRNVRAPFGGD